MVTQDTSKTHAGHLKVFIDGASAGVTLGGPELTYEKESVDIDTDDFGIVDKSITNNSATVTVRFAQVEPDVLALAIPEATLTASGTIEVGSARGTSLLSVAKTLVLSGTNGTNSQQWTFHKAFVEEGFDLSYEDEQSVIEVPFRVVPDPDNLTATDALFKYETFVT
jgi:hypothetical protein